MRDIPLFYITLPGNVCIVLHIYQSVFYKTCYISVMDNFEAWCNYFFFWRLTRKSVRLALQQCWLVWMIYKRNLSTCTGEQSLTIFQIWGFMGNMSYFCQKGRGQKFLYGILLDIIDFMMLLGGYSCKHAVSTCCCHLDMLFLHVMPKKKGWEFKTACPLTWQFEMCVLNNGSWWDIHIWTCTLIKLNWSCIETLLLYQY